MSNLSKKAQASRAAAVQHGRTEYEGRKCHRCHTVWKYLDGKCVECSNHIQDSYYKRNREEMKEKARARYRANPSYQLWRNAQTRAKWDNTEFDIEPEHIIIPEYCPVLGIPMDSPSLDRFDNDRGYTVDNIRVISRRANTLKSNATIEELEKILDYMRG